MQVDNDKKLEATDKVYKFNDTVDVKIAYPKDFAGKKHFKDGEIVNVHVLQADYLESKNIGKRIK